MLKKLIALTAVALLAACSSGEPQVNVQAYEVQNSIVVKVTSKADEITIEDMQVNRGNCKVKKYAEAMNKGLTFPRTLRFGEAYEYYYHRPCELTEVEVITDLGDWTWSFE